MSKNLYEISISFDSKDPFACELLMLALDDIGISATDIAETEYQGEKNISFYMDSRCRADSLTGKLSSSLKNVRVSCAEIKDDDWKIRWKDYLKPFDIADSFRIIPLWMSQQRQNTKKQLIFIDTDIVFGAGTHPTSQLSAAFIESKKGKFYDFLDVGTGTGLLSIIAQKCGASNIWAVDITDDAIAVAARNMEINNCRAGYLKAMDFKKFRSKQKFDFVAANVLTDELIRLNKQIVDSVREGKYLAVSGISANKLGYFRERFCEENLRCLSVKEKDGWVALLYKKI